MILGVQIDELPNQLEFTDVAAYAQALRVYLYKHFNKTYVEVLHPSPPTAVKYLSAPHILIGDVARASGTDAWHAVIYEGGGTMWDVHPSRAGLTKVVKHGVIVPFVEAPVMWRRAWSGYKEACVCKACKEERRVATAA
jgi:hypothetical protein